MKKKKNQEKPQQDMILYGSQKMDINSQHHNLLGNQISPKSENVCILAAICGSKWLS